MRVQSWQAFSCNNSGSYHLVARFDGEAKAKVAAEKLRAFFEAHSQENYQGQRSLAMTEVAIEHDFEWDGDIHWAEDWDSEYESLRVDLFGDTVLLYHSYTLGIGGISPFIHALGGQGEDYYGEPRLAAFFHFQPNQAGQREHAALSQYFARDSDNIAGPWGSPMNWGDKFWWSDGKSGGFFGSFSHEQFEELNQYFAGEGFTDYRIVLGSSELRERIRILADCPLCPECEHPLGVLEAGLSAPEALATCMGCGGMFELLHLRANSHVSRICEATVTHLVVQDTSVIALDSYGQVRRHSDGLWSCVQDPAGVSSLLMTASNRVLLGRTNQALQQSLDEGLSFEDLGPKGLHLLGETPGGVLFATTSQRSLVRSQDGGGTWESASKSGRTPITSMTAASDSLLYLTRQNGNLLRSDNGGMNWKGIKTTWQEALHAIVVLSSVPVSPPSVHAICVGAKGTVLRSSDGVEWHKQSCSTSADIFDLLLGSDNTLYAVNGMGELMISTDEALSWEFQAITNDSLTCIARGPQGRLWVSGRHGVVVQIC